MDQENKAVDNWVEKKSRKRVSKDDWLNAGLAVLGSRGVEAIRVERLARELRISKSGFYWHFKDRADFLSQLMEFWETEYTQVVATDRGMLKGTPKQRLRRLMRLIEAGELAKYDSAFQIWSKTNESVKRAFERVMRWREEFVSSILRETGIEGEELEIMTMIFVLYNIGERNTFFYKGKNKLEKMRSNLLSIICDKCPPQQRRHDV